AAEKAAPLPARSEHANPDEGAPEKESAGHARIHPLTWGLLGAGGAGFGTALAFELARGSQGGDARHASTGIEGKSAYDGAKTDQTVARVALVAGSAFAIAGGVLLYLDLSSGSHSEENVTARVGCGARDCGISVHGRF